jgi:hypothetical protein
MIQQKFINAIMQHASLANSNRFFVTTGIITAYDPENYLVIVQTDSADPDYPAAQTGWIPLCALWVGNQWGLFCPPNLGDVCSVFYLDSDSQVQFAGPRFFGDSARPLSVPSGEMWVVHQSGSYFKMTNDGNLLLNGNVEIDITAPTVNITVSGECNLSANTVNIEADSVNLGQSSGLLELINSNFQTTFNTHKHGGGPVPDVPMPTDNLTVNTMAT